MPTLSTISQRNIDTLLNAAGDFNISQINALKQLLANYTGGDTQAVYSSGTNYVLTTVANSPIVHGTTSPTLTMLREGTYLLNGYAVVDANAATTSGIIVLTRLRRTNNNPTPFTPNLILRVPNLTAATQSVLTVSPPPVIATVSAGDIITVTAHMAGAAPSAGTLEISNSGLVATRLY